MRQAHQLFVLLVLAPICYPTFLTAGVSRANDVARNPTFEIGLDCPSKFSGGEYSQCKIFVTEGQQEELTFKVSSSNSSLVQVFSGEVKLPSRERSVFLKLTSSPTQINSSVSIRVSLHSTDQSLHSTDQLTVQRDIEVVPALIKTVTVLQSSMIGTHGAFVQCHAELKAPAPSGGIELYISPIKISPGATRGVSLFIENPRVPGGQRSVDFNFEYNALRADNTAVGSDLNQSDFNLETRSIEIVVALDPQNTKLWQPIPNIAPSVKFDVVPLRVSSFSAQPQAVVSGGESIATFSLNGPPGDNEEAGLSPLRTTSSLMWVVPVGSSCQDPTPTNGSFLILPLTQGSTTFSFKVCTGTVTAIATGKVGVVLRSGEYDMPFTIQPQ